MFSCYAGVAGRSLLSRPTASTFWPERWTTLSGCGRSGTTPNASRPTSGFCVHCFIPVVTDSWTFFGLFSLRIVVAYVIFQCCCCWRCCHRSSRGDTCTAPLWVMDELRRSFKTLDRYWLISSRTLISNWLLLRNVCKYSKPILVEALRRNTTARLLQQPATALSESVETAVLKAFEVTHVVDLVHLRQSNFPLET